MNFKFIFTIKSEVFIRRCLVLAAMGLICFSSQSYGWPPDIPGPDDPTVAEKVDWIWENVIRSTVMGRGRGGYTNFFDQLHADAAMGKFQVCIRWDSRSENVSVEKRDCIEEMLQRHMKEWTDAMIGHDGWPWIDIPVRISGWAGYSSSNF